MRAKATSSSASAQSPGCFDRLLQTRRAFTVAQDARTGDPAPHNHRESGECRLKGLIEQLSVRLGSGVPTSGAVEYSVARALMQSRSPCDQNGIPR